MLWWSKNRDKVYHLPKYHESLSLILKYRYTEYRSTTRKYETDRIVDNSLGKSTLFRPTYPSTIYYIIFIIIYNLLYNIHYATRKKIFFYIIKLFMRSQLSIQDLLNQDYNRSRRYSILSLLLTKHEHQDRHSGQTGQTYGERHRLADNSQGAKDEIADTVCLKMSVLQLKYDRAVCRYAKICSFRVALFRCFCTAGAKPTRFVAWKLKAHMSAQIRSLVI